jgi:hypothetical protein
MLLFKSLFFVCAAIITWLYRHHTEFYFIDEIWKNGCQIHDWGPYQSSLSHPVYNWCLLPHQQERISALMLYMFRNSPDSAVSARSFGTNLNLLYMDGSFYLNPRILHHSDTPTLNCLMDSGPPITVYDSLTIEYYDEKFTKHTHSLPKKYHCIFQLTK